MTETIRLRKEPIDSGVHILKLPKYLRPTGFGTYWHIPRSASNGKHGLFVRLWCGQSRFAVHEHDLKTERPEEMLCGTCDGRADGFLAEQELIFRPHNAWFPKWCPGWGTGPKGRECALCGERVKFHYHRWGGGVTEARHRPSEKLLEMCSPCPRHGWEKMQNFRQGWNTDPIGIRCVQFQCDYYQEIRL